MKKPALPTTKRKAPINDAAEVDPRFAPVADAFAKDRQVTYGTMMASIGLKVNGKIFAMMVKGRFVAKLPKDRVGELVRSGKGEYLRISAIHGLETLRATEALPYLRALLNDRELPSAGDQVSVADTARAAILKLESQ